jgi:hypothetical protein
MRLELPETPAEIEQTLEQFSTKVRESKTASTALDPQTAEELVTYRILTRNSKIATSVSFSNSFVKPLESRWAKFANHLASSIPSNDQQAMQGWAANLNANYKPEQITPQWLEEN